MSVQEFGRTDDGRTVSLFTIANDSGIRAGVTDLGATLVFLQVPDSKGGVEDVILGLGSASDYLRHADTYFGSTVGRFGNRIARGNFTLDGRTIQLGTNNAPGGVPCHLHGGAHGFHRRLWSVDDVQPDAVCFSYRSEDGEEGYPGALTVKVTYRLEADRVLTWTAEAATDAPTIVNVVHHPYWNLSAGSCPTIDRHVLQLFADSYLPVTDGKVPIGEIRPVAGTPMDFRQPRAIGEHGNSDYDHCWVVEKGQDVGGLSLAARLSDPLSGRVLEVFTDQPGIQFYDGGCLDGSAAGRHGRSYGPRSGLCLEPQKFPDAPNHPGFPSCRLAPGEVYVNRVRYKLAAG